MLVSRVIGDCPSCGAVESYGNVSIGKQSVLRGCSKCNYSERIPLPKIEKKIIYLDQFFYSRAFTFRDKKYDAKYVCAIEKISELANKQLLVTPFSSIHADEAYQWNGKDGKSKKELMQFIKVSSHGHEFQPAYSVKREQLLKNFERFRTNTTPALIVDPSVAIKKEFHDWSDYLWFDVNGYFGDAEVLKEAKDAAIDGLMSVFDNWMNSKNTFSQQIELEYKSTAQAYFQQFSDYVKLISTGNTFAHLNASLDSMIIEGMFSSFPKETDYDSRITIIMDFFKSDHFKMTPHEWISSRAFALLMERVREGDYRNREKAKTRLRGIFQDISFIATYAPHCDAIFIDKAMAALLRNRRINLTKHFGTIVFSEENWEDFIDYLRSLEVNISHEHSAALKLAYPEP